MRALLLGSGGRESAMAWALDASAHVDELVVAPGNPGVERFADTRAIDPSAPDEVVRLADEIDAGLVVIGPEAPLIAGVGDVLRDKGRNVFGPGAPAAHIEGSKSFAKELMLRAGIPTAEARTADSLDDALAALDEFGSPYVIKADGLAAGKGVTVTTDRTEAIEAIEARLVRRVFGDAGRHIVIERFLDGQEASLIAFVDGRNLVPCAPAQDYKRAFDDDEGPNTGGMGSYSPVPACPPELSDKIVSEVLEPMVLELDGRGTPFVGALYAGLALSPGGPRVIEFNARFGDPETQALLPRLSSDFGELCLASATGDLAGVSAEWSMRPCISVVLTSDGYPGAYETGHEINGLDEANAREDVFVFHAGTARDGDRIVTAGGRVLAVSALGDDYAEARARAYDAASLISFEGKHLRNDIGQRAESAVTER
jgi:phosphoribosylamine--glycine ligase